MSLSCTKCTFSNPPSEKSTCQVCFSPLTPSPSPSSPSPSKSRWSCKACTFLNPYTNTNCEICGTRSLVSSLLSLDGDDSSVGSVFLPLRPCKSKLLEPDGVNGDSSRQSVEFRGPKSAGKKVVVPDDIDLGTSQSSLKILSYNVWFREDLELYERMKALGDLIQLHSPDFICFQEVTPYIYAIFEQFTWWRAYHCSVSRETAKSRPYFCMQLSRLTVKSFRRIPFGNSIMGRELCVADLEACGINPLVIATSHLESPCPGPPKWDQMYSKERVDQAKEALNRLETHQNVIFCGDMNWDDKLDGPFPLPEGWVDAWVAARGPGEDGWTYDTKSNRMLAGNRTLQKRLDRFVCRLTDFRISQIDMIGMEAIPGVTYCKEKRVKKEMQKVVLPVLPSDHYGLLVTICRQ